MFLQAHEPELTDEDERLERMDVATKEWWNRIAGEALRQGPFMFLYRYNIHAYPSFPLFYPLVEIPSLGTL